MSNPMAEARLLVQVAFRNLLAHRLKSAIVGGIILFGAVLVVAGGSLVENMDASMSRSVVGSVSGHVQVYSSASKDKLELFGGFTGFPDLTAIPDFKALKETLGAVENVERVVPMGINGAIVTSGNTMDLALERLRNAVGGPGKPPAEAAEIASRKAHVRRMVEVLQSEMKNVQVLGTEEAVEPEELADLARAASPGFWAGFDKDPLAALEFMENRVAPNAADADLLWVSYIGTDLDAFSKAFDRMEIVDGTAVPIGQRGFLFPKFYYEMYLKLKSARRLDDIKEQRDLQGKTIATDKDLQRLVRENTQQLREIVLQLDEGGARKAVAALQSTLGSQEKELAPLLAAFFDMSDQNFDARYQVFYQQIAPLLELYRVRVGDTFTIKAFTRSGYIQSINLKVYGTYQFKGLEKAGLAGQFGLMDLLSFRDLYGYATPEKAAETSALKGVAGLKEIARDQAEAELFGGGGERVAKAAGGDSHFAEAERSLGDIEVQKAERSFDPAAAEAGPVLNAAIFLKDPKRTRETMAAIEEAGKKANIQLKAVTWQEASGFLGQFVMVLRAALLVAVLVIFAIALVIINNALVMAALERVREIGTLRAIGAQRRFVLTMVLVETGVIALVFGGLGTILGAAVVKLLNQVGIPAATPELYFFFSGPRLHPTLGGGAVLAALIIVVLVSILSSLYPARLAMRVQPVVAMQTAEE
jgi:ABC-type lipoprotein release transport system permease subunit